MMTFAGKSAAMPQDLATTASPSFVLVQTAALIEADLSISSGRNAVCAGPVEIDGGVTVDIGAESRWVIV